LRLIGDSGRVRPARSLPQGARCAKRSGRAAYKLFWRLPYRHKEPPVHFQGIRHPRVTHAIVAPVLLLLGALSLAGCGSQPTAAGAQQADAPRDQTFTRVLVVGVTPHVNQRCAFEFFLASQIKSESTKGVRSCDAVKEKNPLTLESIEAAIAAQQVDAVVATTLVTADWAAEEGRGRDERGGGMYKATDAGYATGYYGAYGIPVVYGEFQTAPSITTVTGEVKVITKVYETRGATLVYTVETTAKNLESRDAALASVAESIAKRLRREGLIR
jgi:hypothetical protein